MRWEHPEGAWPMNRYCLCEWQSWGGEGITQHASVMTRCLTLWQESRQKFVEKFQEGQWVGQCNKERLYVSLTWPKGRARTVLGRPGKGGQRNRMQCSCSAVRYWPLVFHLHIHMHALFPHICTFSLYVTPSTLQNKPGLKAWILYIKQDAGKWYLWRLE